MKICMLVKNEWHTKMGVWCVCELFNKEIKNKITNERCACVSLCIVILCVCVCESV